MKTKLKQKKTRKKEEKPLSWYIRLGGGTLVSTYGLETALQLFALAFLRKKLLEAFMESYEVCTQMVKTGRDDVLYRCIVVNMKNSPQAEEIEQILEALALAGGFGILTALNALYSLDKNDRLVTLATVGAATGTATIFNTRLLLNTIIDKLAYRWLRHIKQIKARA